MSQELLKGLSLFGEEIDTTKYLQIIKDGKIADLHLEQIFDNAQFDELYVVSYVSSPRFFSRVAEGFSRVKVILGIPDSELLSSFVQGLVKFMTPEESILFWNELTLEVKEKVQNNAFQIRFAIPFGPKSISVHSKIYLLRHSQSLQTRVIIGSANLTENAFVRKGQFEEILIFDNSELYDIYKERFELIYNKTIDYLPEQLKKKDKTQLIVASDVQELEKVLLENTDRIRKLLVLTEPELEKLKVAPIEISYQRERTDITNNVLEILLQKKNDRYVLRPKEEIIKKSIAIKQAVCISNKKSEEIDNRIFLQYIDKEDFFYYGTKRESQIQPFSETISKAELTKTMHLINSFVEAYGLFTFNPEKSNQSKVFEIILYAFMSPFIWKIRSDFALKEGRESVKRYFQPFLIIGGKAGSGKTTVLEFISMLLGGNNSERYLHYSKVDGKRIIFDYFHSDNLYPILVDEVPSSFFNSKAQDKGESLIKYISNELSSKHPVFIATTNLSEFNVSSQVLTRVYYLEIDKVFDKDKFAESSKYLNELLANTNNLLFKDFTYQIGRLIKDKESFYKIEDMLSFAREVFRNYYKEADMKLPSWFPETTFRDYEERGKRLWKNLFKAHRKAFKENSEDNTIFVDMNEFCEIRQRPIFINYLSAASSQEEGAILVLGKKEFYDFIGYNEEMYKKVDEGEKAIINQKIKEEISLEQAKAEMIRREADKENVTKIINEQIEKMMQLVAKDREEMEWKFKIEEERLKKLNLELELKARHKKTLLEKMYSFLGYKAFKK